MYFVLLAAAIAILAGVVAVALGRGGDMVAAGRDVPAIPLGFRSASEIATLRLPMGLFGYQQQATEEALHAAAVLLAERDAEVARLREDLWRLGAESGSAAGPAGGGTGQPAPAEGSAQAGEAAGGDVLTGQSPGGG